MYFTQYTLHFTYQWLISCVKCTIITYPFENCFELSSDSYSVLRSSWYFCVLMSQFATHPLICRKVIPSIKIGPISSICNKLHYLKFSTIQRKATIILSSEVKGTSIRKNCIPYQSPKSMKK